MADFFSVEHLNVLREFIAHGIILLGALFVVVGSVGVLRFPDFYTRMHAASVTDTLGATLVIAGMMLLAGWSLNSFRLFMTWLCLFLTSPTASNAAANAALKAGLEPMLGKWTGAPKDDAAEEKA